jgi:hypothetical protein
VEVELADGSIYPLALGIAHLRLLDREAPRIVGFGDGGQPLIGATTLENLILGVDSISKCLMPMTLKGRPI